VPGLHLEPPPVPGAGRDRRETTACDRAVRRTRGDQGEHHHEGEQQGDRVREEAGKQAGVRAQVVVVGGRSRGVARRSALGSGGAPSLGDVLSLVGGGRDQVADEVETVPVGHPPR
jgi:hypothetical protein